MCGCVGVWVRARVHRKSSVITQHDNTMHTRTLNIYIYIFIYIYIYIYIYITHTCTCAHFIMVYRLEGIEGIEGYIG